MSAPSCQPNCHYQSTGKTRIHQALKQANWDIRQLIAPTDLGVAQLNAGDARGALAVRDEAVAIAREVADRYGEMDALGNLGLASVSAGQPQRALQIFEHLRAYAHDAGDCVVEKLALSQLGLACSQLGDHAQAVALFEQALALARHLGDRKHEAELSGE